MESVICHQAPLSLCTTRRAHVRSPSSNSSSIAFATISTASLPCHRSHALFSLFAFPTSHSLSPTRSFHNHHLSSFFSLMLHNTLTDKQLTLFCLVEGEAMGNVFPVSTSSAAAVGELKDFIKTKKAPRFDDIAADELTLWKVCIAIPDDEEILILLDRLNEKKKLGPATRISKVFTEELPEETVHIVVQRPPRGTDVSSVPLSGKCSCFMRVLFASRCVD
ncbi:hypothetical protein B0O80DRAFT_165799 [Mortierella sp. GBAus27b]|nr:hypothetical protein B0O80DRAFT_165799 [Mortierella sp. GBAus27b]